MIIALLGRQPSLGIAELERLYGSGAVRWFSSTSATVRTDTIDVTSLGGTVKAGHVVAEFRNLDWRGVSKKIVQAYAEAWSDREVKITLGISAYGFSTTARDVQKTGLMLKSRLKNSGVSLRLIPNSDVELSSATSHHNKLGLADNKVELLVVRNKNGKVIVAESLGAQNISALAARDQGRPKRDAFVGMLPPKLALSILNLAVGPVTPSRETVVLDPFCGTGVVLQEALLRGFSAYGTDLSDKMIDYSAQNLDWLIDHAHLPKTKNPLFSLHQGDATSYTWQPTPAIVACESYLGQPFSAPPSPAKLREVRGNCNHIISEFLKNIARQLPSGAPLCVAVPAWRDASGNFTHLPLTRELESLGFSYIPLETVRHDELLYYREDQVVARQLLVITRK